MTPRSASLVCVVLAFLLPSVHARQTARPPEAAMVVSTAWLAEHLTDAGVAVIATGDRAAYDQAHIPGARFVDHAETMDTSHRLLGPEALSTALARAGAANGRRVIVYGDHPMATGWLYVAFASIGHADAVSMLDGGLGLWQSQGRPTSTAAPAAATGTLTPRPAADVGVNASWVRARLDDPAVKLLDVRTDREWQNGRLPNATLVLWQDLFIDPRAQTFKSPDEIRALLARAGVKPTQQVVTYCAIGMRASLMYFAARYAGLPARVYLGSFEDWQRQSGYPIVR